MRESTVGFESRGERPSDRTGEVGNPSRGSRGLVCGPLSRTSYGLGFGSSSKVLSEVGFVNSLKSVFPRKSSRPEDPVSRSMSFRGLLKSYIK